MSQKATRKKRKQRRHTAPAGDSQAVAAPPEPAQPEPTIADRYARSRARDEAARAALKPLADGERPRAVTAGALTAVGLLIANLVTLIVGYDSDQPAKTVYALLGIVILAACAWGMWRVRYWAVLGMQMILALAMIGSAFAAVNAKNALAFVLVIAILAGAGTLFWFLVKSMARIQMPERPGTR